MRVLSSIPVLVSVMLIATACESSGEPGTHVSPLLIVAPAAGTIKSGATLALYLTAHDEFGDPTVPTNVTWTSSDPKVAGVSGDGVVSAQGIGASDITAYWNGAHAISKITVTNGTESRSCSTGEPLFSIGRAGDQPALIKRACTAQ
jgi:Bacterial Ig-like domain (group 2)